MPAEGAPRWPGLVRRWASRALCAVVAYHLVVLVRLLANYWSTAPAGTPAREAVLAAILFGGHASLGVLCTWAGLIRGSRRALWLQFVLLVPWTWVIAEPALTSGRRGGLNSVPLLVAAAVWAIAVAGGVATLRDKTLAR